ncbi:hypothetical protein Tco_0331705 [Tanacetum coccineum]
MFICNAVMTIDKSWTTISNRNSEEFLDGLFAFIKHCKPLLHPITQKIHCPCSRCCNRDDNRVTLEILEVHISRYGFDQHYTTWKYHGEPILPLPPQVPHSPEHVDMDTFFEDISANNVPTPPTQTTGPQPFQTTGPNNEFEELLSRSTKKLYPGCDMSTLEFTTEISHIKALHKITDAGFNKILALLQKACPPSKGYNFPSSYYEIKKTYKKIGLGYESIHACINDCFLFWGSEENLKMPNCPVCKESRYKKKTKAGKDSSKEKGKMNHPCDGRAWKYFDMMKPEFSGDARNVRLGLAADGFNPFGMMSQTYSMWPVILTTYNTPPWMCMKETSLMLTMLIPGPKSPAKDIDVYLQPLIKELQELWKGVWTKETLLQTVILIEASVTSLLSTTILAQSIAAPIIEFFAYSLKQLCARTLMHAGQESRGYTFYPMRLFKVALFATGVMLPLERYMKKLKNHVRNKAKLKVLLRRQLYGLYLTTFLKSTADIWLTEKISPDNVETNFPLVLITSEELFSLACGPISCMSYPLAYLTCEEYGLVHERDIFHTTQCNGVSTGEMYYGQLEEILELTYIGNRIFNKNNTKYILATQVTTKDFYLEDLARQPRGWKVVEHVYHRDVAESDQDVIHGSSSSNVTLSVELTNFEHTDLSINSESTEVDAPPVNDDNANAK